MSVKRNGRKTIFNMKTNIPVIMFTVACAIILSSCGGGSNSGKSSLKKNDYLGSLPAIYANMALAKEADKEKMKELRATANTEKIMKGAAKMKEEASVRDAKLDAELKAEAAKLAGKEIPFTYSEEFKKGNCEVQSLKLGDRPGYIIASVVAKDNFKSDPYQLTYAIYYKALAKDGSTIAENLCFYLKKKASYTKGEALKTSDDKDAESYLTIYVNPEMWLDFASIEFVQ